METCFKVNIPNVEGVKKTATRLEFRVVDVTIQGVELGDYLVSVSIPGGHVEITRPPEWDGGVVEWEPRSGWSRAAIHPHVYGNVMNGSRPKPKPCFGHIRMTIEELIGGGKLVPAILIIRNFLFSMKEMPFTRDLLDKLRDVLSIDRQIPPPH